MNHPPLADEKPREPHLSLCANFRYHLSSSDRLIIATAIAYNAKLASVDSFIGYAELQNRLAGEVVCKFTNRISKVAIIVLA